MTAALGIAGLAVSLGGPVILMLAIKHSRIDPLSIPGRLLLWFLALIALVIAMYGAGPSWLARLGVQPFGWLDFVAAIVVVIASIVGATGIHLLQGKLRINNAEGAKVRQKILGLSARRRLFVVVTAAVVEEVLYRGYAIGIGQQVWGSLAVAFAVSLSMFVVVHLSHGVAQLITVGWIALLISLLFVITNNLFACILVHFVMDAAGVLVMPWAASRKRAKKVSLSRDG